MLKIGLEKRLKGTVTLSHIVGVTGTKHSPSIKDEISSYIQYMDLQPLTFKVGDEEVDLGYGLVRFQGMALDILVDEERLPKLGDGILTVLPNKRAAFVTDISGGAFNEDTSLQLPVDYTRVVKNQLVSNQRVRYTPVNKTKFIAAEDIKPLAGESNGVIHHISPTTNGLIILENGGIVNFDRPNRHLVGNAFRFKHGMNVKLDYSINPKGMYARIDNRLFAYNVSLDYSLMPTFVGVVEQTRYNLVSTPNIIKDVFSRNSYDLEEELPIGTFVSFKLRRVSSKKGYYTPTEISTITELPYGKYIGKVKTAQNSEAGLVTSKETGDLKFFRDEVLHLGENYWPVIPEMVKEGTPVRFDVIGTGNERLATNLVLDLSIPYKS